MILGLLEEQPQYFLVEVKIKPTNNIKVFLDGDQGITIEKCIAVNRALYKQLEESGMFPDGDFSPRGFIARAGRTPEIASAIRKEYGSHGGGTNERWSEDRREIAGSKRSGAGFRRNERKRCTWAANGKKEGNSTAPAFIKRH